MPLLDNLEKANQPKILGSFLQTSKEIANTRMTNNFGNHVHESHAYISNSYPYVRMSI